MKKAKIKRKNKKKKGFTLIELLAVIIILGVLVIIAIPSITKYINDSRKNAYVTSASQYITGARNKINSNEIPIYDTSVTYYIPRSCVPLEKGGDSPFGDWEEAYIVATYDGSKYDYYWTSRDSSNMGIYLTSEDLLNRDSVISNVTSISTNVSVGDRDTILVLDDTCDVNSAVEKEVEDSIEENGVLTVIDTALYFGKKYKVNDTSYYVFNEDGSIEYYSNCKLDSTRTAPAGSLKYDGDEVTGSERVTIKVSTNKKKVNIRVNGYSSAATLNDNLLCDLQIMKTKNSSSAFWQYSSQIKTITFENKINIPSDVDEEFKWDVSAYDNGTVMAYITPNKDNSSYYDLYIQGDGMIYAPIDSSYLFSGFNVLEEIINFRLLNTSKTTSIEGMFKYCRKLTNLDLSNFDTRNVTRMGSMFYECSSLISLDLSSFDTSKVTNMDNMFYFSGLTSLDISSFDTSNVTSMYNMFAYSNLLTLDVRHFNTSKVTNMSYMFNNCDTLIDLDLSSFDTRNVTNMMGMFCNCQALKTLDISSFDTSKVTNMGSMFIYVPASCNVKVKDSTVQSWVLDNDNGHNSSWSTTNVTFK